MGSIMKEVENIIDVSSMSDSDLDTFKKENGMNLKNSEIRMIVDKIGRNPSLVELHIFNTEWSEHCSYKSSRRTLKLLPTSADNVMLGPQEDAGIIDFCVHNGEKYGIVIAHESHNHPSQVVPFEGAATGIGGIVRDVLCMGAQVIAVADPLRFGDPKGPNKNKVKYIANGVVDGIAGYGNPLGVPNIGGDVYFNSSFDDNCLVNVACLGLVKEDEIIHSFAPECAGRENYDIIVVGKATDNSGFGGASFASVILDEGDEDANKGAVQVPDPFLKNLLFRATYKVFDVVRKKKIKVGFKDMGAGGIMCSTSEMAQSGGFGADIDLSKVHTSIDIPPHIIACSETQERFTWFVPKSFTQEVLDIYNKDYDLPNIVKGAMAVVVGHVTEEKNFVMRYDEKIVCNLPIDEVTAGILYDRKRQKKEFKGSEPEVENLVTYNQVLLDVLAHPNVCSREKIYKHYDTEVMGNAVIRSGEADAGLIAPIKGCSYGIAMSVDANPKFSRIDPYWGAVNAVAESMRNVASVGAVPSGLTDCLCFGNPEDPVVFDNFVESVKGIADAANLIEHFVNSGPVPVVSGNVSFYNENSKGNQVDPSPIIACVGIIDDVSKAVRMSFRNPDSQIFLVGARKNELGGSVYYDLLGHQGANVPKPDFKEHKNMIHAVIESIGARLVESCHDISDGGLITAVSEMCISGRKRDIGASLEFNDCLRNDVLLFSESGGFILEVRPQNEKNIEKIFFKYGADLIRIGQTTPEKTLKVISNEEEIISLDLKEMTDAWKSSLPKILG
jgi:phosphoribosylformylglycinamidine synthase subunit PurL